MNIPGWYNGMIADPSSVRASGGNGDAGPNPAPGTESQPEWECRSFLLEQGDSGSPFNRKIMDYEKKYNEALDKARTYYRGLANCRAKDELENIFSELRESEDERIRKLLVWQVYRNIEDETNDLAQSVYDGIKGHDPDIEESIEDWKRCLAWLEKQKEQKPEEKSEKPIIPEWSEEALNVMNLVYRCIRKVLAEFAVYTENEELLESREETVCYYSQRCAEKILKSLRPQYHGDVTMTEAYKMGKEAGEASHWKPSEDELTKKHLEGYIKGRNDALREMSDFMESHFNTNKAKEGEDLTDLYYKEYVGNPQPIPTGWGCDGIHCTNPQMDCMNCPRRTMGGSFSTSSASGTSAATLHGNTSVTDGKPHNPSFTD